MSEAPTEADDAAAARAQAADAAVVERARQVSRDLDELNARLLRAIQRGDAAWIRRFFAGPLDVAARGTLTRLDSTVEPTP